MTTTAQRIRDHIDDLEDGEMFATQEVLYCGVRNAVDLALFNMVRNAEIFRLARGLFLKILPGVRMPSVIEIAKKKAAVFRKKIVEHGGNAAIKFGFVDKRRFFEPHLDFYTTGCSSSFHCNYGRIKFKAVSKRKFNLPLSRVGKLLKAIWYMGFWKRFKIRNKARHIERCLDRIDRLSFRMQITRVPNWIRRMFYLTIKRSYKKLEKSRF